MQPPLKLSPCALAHSLCEVHDAEGIPIVKSSIFGGYRRKPTGVTESVLAEVVVIPFREFEVLIQIIQINKIVQLE